MFVELKKTTRDDTGRRFGRLVALGPIEVRHYANGNRAIIYLCKCDCGNETKVRSCNLATKHTKSCGCLGLEQSKTRHLKHGHARIGKATPEYRLWVNIKKRCLDTNNKSYHAYGGRGIRMADKWQSSFEAFLSDVGERPTPGHSIDRIDNDGHYEPGNVRWATKNEQANNTRTNRMITISGETMTASQWSRVSGVSADAIYNRLNKGWSSADAVHRPVRNSRVCP